MDTVTLINTVAKDMRIDWTWFCESFVERLANGATPVEAALQARFDAAIVPVEPIRILPNIFEDNVDGRV